MKTLWMDSYWNSFYSFWTVRTIVHISKRLMDRFHFWLSIQLYFFFNPYMLTFSPCVKWFSIALISDFNLSIWDSTRAFSLCNSDISASNVIKSSPLFAAGSIPTKIYLEISDSFNKAFHLLTNKRLLIIWLLLNITVLFLVALSGQPTCISFRVKRHVVGVFGLLDRLPGDRTSAEGAVREEGPIYVAGTIAARCGTIDAFEFHCGRSCDGRFVLLHRSATLKDSHLVSVGYWTARCTVQTAENYLFEYYVTRYFQNANKSITEKSANYKLCS